MGSTIGERRKQKGESNGMDANGDRKGVNGEGDKNLSRERRNSARKSKERERKVKNSGVEYTSIRR